MTPWMRSGAGLLASLAALLCVPATPTPAQVALPDAKPVPAAQVIPLPHHEVSFSIDGVERARYHHDPGQRRPFLFPIVGPSGRSLTRMGHPHDPEGHSHHNSVWMSHDRVNGESFWADTGPGRIVHRRLVRLDDGDDAARLVVENDWIGSGDRVVLHERRGMTIRPLDDAESLMILDLRLEPAGTDPVTLGESAFGLVGVRMAKTIGTNDGGGLIRNSEGNAGEQGENGVFRKPARWVDYSGPITREAIEGITLLDHPANPSFPTPFHVRADGWMGASLTYQGPIVVERDRPLRLRYGLYIHRGAPTVPDLDAQWRAFADLRVEELPDRP